MSKEQELTKKKCEFNVETVENLIHLLSWISSTLVFWKMDQVFPCNLIKKCCDDFYDNLVSLSHIIDK